MKKVLKKVLSCIAISAAFVLVSALPACKSKECTLTIDDETTYQTVTGWGSSSAWFSQEVPQNSQTATTLASELYSEDGLGLTIYRYNIGGGSADLGCYNGSNTETQSAFIADNYDSGKTALENFSDANNYDFTRDANAINFLKLCCTQTNSTVKRVILFCNSPHYLLTESGYTHGSYEYQNNLAEENYEAFSAYILMYVDYFINQGIEIYSISPVNEPQNRWNGISSVQEGCHYEPENLAAFYNVFINELEEYNQNNGTDIKTDILESNCYEVYNSKTRLFEYLNAMEKYSYFEDLDAISVHTYGEQPLSDEVRGSFVSMLTKLYGNKFEVDMSETCQMSADVDNGMDSGIWLAQVIDKDMRLLNATNWSWWIGAGDGSYNDGLINWDRQSGELTYTKRYFVLSQYTSFVKEGYVRCGGEITASDDITVSCYKGDSNIIAVIVNTGKEAVLNLPQNYLQTTITVTDNNYSKEEIYSGLIPQQITLTAQSVTTIVFS